MSDFVLAKVEIEETAATIAADREYLGHAVHAIKAARLEVERQVRRDDFFLTTMEPYEPPANCPRVVSRMCEASRRAGVGPMAAVAGGIAQEALEAMVAHGCSHAWVDNGGDIAMQLREQVVVEIFSEPGAKSALAIEFGPTKGIVGMCTSSGRLGHSISFGDSDATVAIAEDAFLVDALATAIGNRIDDSETLRTCFDEFRGMKGFTSGLALRDGEMAMYGEFPKVSEVDHNPERITVHNKMASPKFIGAADQNTEVRA